MLLGRRLLLALSLTIALVAIPAIAQEPGAAGDPAPPLGVDKMYFDLTKSTDRSIKSAAESYISLVKIQEWSDLSGKFKTIAYYVSHDPKLTTVTIAIVTGKGAERKTEQKTVPVDKLSPTCQSRVRRIDAMQKKLKEAGAKAGENGAAPGGAAAEGLGRQELGGPAPAQGPEAPQAAPAAPAPIVDQAPDPSASESDPLGFAEVPLTTPPAPQGM